MEPSSIHNTNEAGRLVGRSHCVSAEPAKQYPRHEESIPARRHSLAFVSDGIVRCQGCRNKQNYNGRRLIMAHNCQFTPAYLPNCLGTQSLGERNTFRTFIVSHRAPAGIGIFSLALSITFGSLQHFRRTVRHKSRRRCLVAGDD